MRSTSGCEEIIRACHCESQRQAQELKEALAKRLAERGLELHADKTKIVYCKDDDRRGDYPEQKFNFLGYMFRARRSKNRWGKHFVNFSSGVSNAATKAIRQEIRAWQLRCRDKRIDDLARMFNRRLDELLWLVLQVGALPDTTPSRSMSRAMGDVEVQTSAATSKTGRVLGTGNCLAPPTLLALG